MIKTRILVIEDNRMLRDGITDMLNEQKDMHVVATIGNSNNILMKAIQTKPHVALVDVGVTKFKKSSIVKLLKDKMPEIKVIGMGFVPSQSDIVEFVEAGASGFILKDATMKEFFGVPFDLLRSEKKYSRLQWPVQYSLSDRACSQKRGWKNSQCGMHDKTRA